MENVVCVQQSNKKKTKQNKNLQQNVKRENPCRTDTRAHLTHIWAPKTQISYRQTRACYGRRGMKNRYCKSKSVVHVAAAGCPACDFGGCLIWLCPSGQTTLFKGSSEQQLWQQLQMSSLHMYDPWHPSTTPSIIHRLLGLSVSLLLSRSPLRHPSLSLAQFPVHPSSQCLSPFCLPQPITFSLCRVSYCRSFHIIARTEASQRQQKAFTQRGALHLTAGAEACLHASTRGEGESSVWEPQLWG